MKSLTKLAAELGVLLQTKKAMLVTAESCTGGQVAEVITRISGSSQWFERGFVTYSNEAKQELLGVPNQVLATHGAVSEATARAMAEGALAHSYAQVAVAVTGIAGPSGGTAQKPVGTVWLAFAWGQRVMTQGFRFEGDRLMVRKQATRAALEGLLGFLAL